MPTGKLMNGEWRKEGYEKDGDGRFLRNPTTFRDWVKAERSTEFLPEECSRKTTLSLRGQNDRSRLVYVYHFATF
jgi:glutathionyl-hydroquinone reductase